MPPRITPFTTAGDALSSALCEHPRKDAIMTKQRRGFACMDVEKRRAIARKGGASVDPAKRSFSKDRDLAANAGRKGGEASRGARASKAA